MRFKAVFMTIGIVYMLLAGSMLMRGPEVMRDFAVPEHVVSSPVFADFFLFFYQLMAAYGVLMILFGYVSKDRGSQLVVAGTFFALNVLLTLRDLSTSDSALGNRLYRGQATLVPVLLDASFAVAFAALALSLASEPPSAVRDRL